MDDEYKKIIAAEFASCVKNTIARLDNAETHRPFHEALLSKDALFWSRFERSFSTSFGQKTIERISKIVVDANGASESQAQKESIVSLTSSQFKAIEDHINLLRNNRSGIRPNWVRDLENINSTPVSGPKESLRVISDLWWSKDGINHYVSIKTVKPNIDQSAEAKRDLLKLKLFDPNCCVYFGLYYNPFGEKRSDYNWTPPMGIFDFNNDPVVLIGRDYWETLGGMGVYDEILEIAKRVGQKTSQALLKLR